MITDNLSILLLKQKAILLKALNRLKLSKKKIDIMNLELDLSDDQLETLESFSARFSRAVDLFVSKYLRTLLLTQDPGYQGTVIDSLNNAEKLGLISDAKKWEEMRRMRNIVAHDYLDEELISSIKEMKQMATFILNLIDQIEK